MPHEDGAAYAPVVATVSLNASICLEVTARGSPAPRAATTATQTGSGAAPSEPDVSSSEPVARGEDGWEDGERSAEEAKANASRVLLPARILQEPRSLLLTTGAAYSDLLHGISPVDVDADLGAATVANWGLLGDASVYEEVGGINQRGTRVSLTYRDVLKVSSAAGKVLGGLRTG